MTDYSRLQLEPGRPLQVEIGERRMPMVGRPTLSAKDATTEVLAAYMRTFVFSVEEGQDFRLEEIHPQWPNPGEKLRMPCASIDEVGFSELEECEPTMLEDTCDVYGEGTVLWKTGELLTELQVDYWAETNAARSAIVAGLPRAFSPSEDRSGVLLSGLPAYYHRPLRVTLGSWEFLDDSDSAYQRERRLRTVVTAEMDVVQLRRVTRLNIVPQYDITDNS